MTLITFYGFNERADLTKARQFETSEQVKDFLKTRYDSYGFGVHELTTSGQYREAAINYDFRPYLTHYLIERHQTGGLQSVWAPNKGLARKALGLHRNDRVLLYPNA